jgi:hypothetical protein
MKIEILYLGGCLDWQQAGHAGRVYPGACGPRTGIVRKIQAVLADAA